MHEHLIGISAKLHGEESTTTACTYATQRTALKTEQHYAACASQHDGNTNKKGGNAHDAGMYPNVDILRVGGDCGQLPEFIVSRYVFVIHADSNAKGGIGQVFLHDQLIVFSGISRGIVFVESRAHASY